MLWSSCITSQLCGIFFLQKIPSLVMVDASEYLCKWQFGKFFNRGVSIRALADIVRVRRLLRRNGGWFVDCDSHWLQSIGAIDIRPPQFGHVFGTMAQIASARRASKSYPTGFLHEVKRFRRTCV